MRNAAPANAWTQANLATWDERAAVHALDSTGFYGIERFRAGEDVLLPIESTEIGEVAGKRLVHLQCHLGIDTLCLARRGAIVSGVDFSATAISTARALAASTGLSATFVQSDVYHAASVIPARSFDVVYVSWGSLNWLPDIERWAAVVADLLAPGGYLYLIEQHPLVSVMKEENGRLQLGYAWRTPADRPVTTDMPTTYNNDPTPLVHTKLHEWDHPLSDILGGILKAGLRLDFFHEHEVLPWRRFSFMVPTGDRLLKLPSSQIEMPLAFSLKASKLT